MSIFRMGGSKQVHLLYVLILMVETVELVSITNDDNPLNPSLLPLKKSRRYSRGVYHTPWYNQRHMEWDGIRLVEFNHRWCLGMGNISSTTKMKNVFDIFVSIWEPNTFAYILVTSLLPWGVSHPMIQSEACGVRWYSISWRQSRMMFRHWKYVFKN